MKPYIKILVGFLCIIGIMIILILSVPEVNGEENTGSLSGYVQDRFRVGNYLNEVHIQIECGGLYNETFTDEAGYYKITDIPIVDCYWNISASKEGYKSEQIERAIDEGSIQDFTLYPSRTWYVDDDAQEGGNGSEEHPYERIQYAIDTAEEGDTIRVWDGTYYENVVVNKTVSLVGNGSEETTIDGGGESSAVNISADWVIMSEFRITGGGKYPDAGIKILSDFNSISNITCLSNKDNGIYLLNSNESTITNNTSSSNNDGGIRLSSASRCIVTNNICLNNSEGIVLESNTYRCTIMNNTCWYNDFGISLYYSRECSIMNNTSSMNKNEGIRLMDTGSCIIMNNTSSLNSNGIKLIDAGECIIMDNICSTNNNGDGIQLYNLNDCAIENNTCTSNVRNGIILSFSSDCTFTNNTCSENNWWGIALSSTLSCTITNNTISENRRGIYLSSSSKYNTAHYNNIFNNTEYGISTTDNNGYKIHATNNWWGDDSGPFHSSKNIQGKGDNVTNEVDFDPWIGKNAPPEALINSISPYQAIEGESILFTGSGTDDGSIERYSWRTEDMELFNGTNSSFALSTLSAGIYTIYLKVQDNHGIWSEEVSMEITILKDTDGDGIPDTNDVFINDAAASKDTDGDGYPDEWNEGKSETDSTTGLKLDEFPDDPKKWKKEEDDGGGGDFLHGFEVMSVVAVVTIITIVENWKRRKKK